MEIQRWSPSNEGVLKTTVELVDKQQHCNSKQIRQWGHIPNCIWRSCQVHVHEKMEQKNHKGDKVIHVKHAINKADKLDKMNVGIYF
jgi:hypothetical protein